MARERRSKAWWRAAVKRWRRSGRTAEVFAKAEGLSVHTLWGWSSRLGDGTRAEHGSAPPMPIEIAVPNGVVGRRAEAVEIEVGDAVVRFDVGADVAYVASLVRALRDS